MLGGAASKPFLLCSSNSSDLTPAPKKRRYRKRAESICAGVPASSRSTLSICCWETIRSRVKAARFNKAGAGSIPGARFFSRKGVSYQGTWS
jgi:hypothetical protein